MSAPRLFAALVGCSLAALGAPVGVVTTTVTTSVSVQTVNNPLSVTQNLFSTQIVAQRPGGQVVFDQSLNFAFSDPAVQALVAQATLALNGIGASSILGPNLTSSQVVFEGSSVATSPAGSREDWYEVDGHIGGVVTFGPAVLTIGALDCQSFAITSSTPRTHPGGFQTAGVGTPSGCTGGTELVLGQSDINANVRWHYVITNFQDVITTGTFRTREVYLLQARDGGSAAAEVPEPGTLGMLLAGVPLFFCLRRPRSSQGSNRNRVFAPRFFAALLGCSLAALGAPVDPGHLIFSVTSSFSSQTVNNPLSVTQNLFSTQIIAQGPGGQVVFDQTLNFAFADPLVQALASQATLALNGNG